MRHLGKTSFVRSFSVMTSTESETFPRSMRKSTPQSLPSLFPSFDFQRFQLTLEYLIEDFFLVLSIIPPMVYLIDISSRIKIQMIIMMRPLEQGLLDNDDFVFAGEEGIEQKAFFSRIFHGKKQPRTSRSFLI